MESTTPHKNYTPPEQVGMPYGPAPGRPLTCCTTSDTTCHTAPCVATYSPAAASNLTYATHSHLPHQKQQRTRPNHTAALLTLLCCLYAPLVVLTGQLTERMAACYATREEERKRANTSRRLIKLLQLRCRQLRAGSVRIGRATRCARKQGAPCKVRILGSLDGSAQSGAAAAAVRIELMRSVQGGCRRITEGELAQRVSWLPAWAFDGNNFTSDGVTPVPLTPAATSLKPLKKMQHASTTRAGTGSAHALPLPPRGGTLCEAIYGHLLHHA